MKYSAEKIVQNSSNVYSLPTIYAELDRQINDPLNNLEDIANTLLEDAGLSARLLKLANSALYSFPSNIETVSKAVTIIGTNQLRDLALATSVTSLFEGIDDSIVDMVEFWKHSIAVGIAARVIATYRYEPNVERYYLMGLLHDIGRILMFIQMPDTMSELIKKCKANVQPFNGLEKEALGFDHNKIGQLLLSEWKLPQGIIDAVSYHHAPMKSQLYTLEASVIHLADLIINSMQLGSSDGVSVISPLNNKAWELVGLSSAQVPDLVARIDSQYSDAIEVLLS